MGKTSTEVKTRWMNKAYHKFTAYFRYDTDQYIIDYLEEAKLSKGVTEIFRDAMALYIEQEKKEWG